MITKSSKQLFLSRINLKEEKMKLSSIIDKCNKCEATSKITTSYFLNLNEKNLIVNFLNREKIKYHVFFPNSYCEKSIIIFLPEYVDKTDIDFNNHIACIKIKCRNMSKLKHKDFMGSIYSLGIKNEFIGDIFLTDDAAFVYLCKSVEQFILDNLFKVSNQEVDCKSIDIYSKEAQSLKIEYISKTYIIPSRRVDALLSDVYSLSRKEIKDKIVAGDLYINSKECINPSETFMENDIISFRKCGKLKVGKEVRKTRNGNLCIEINKYK